MIDEIDHARLEKKKSSDCPCQRVRADAVVLASLFFSEASLALHELRMRMLKQHEGCHFSSGVGAWPMGA